jgi:hypothetical protein
MKGGCVKGLIKFFSNLIEFFFLIMSIKSIPVLKTRDSNMNLMSRGIERRVLVKQREITRVMLTLRRVNEKPLIIKSVMNFEREA